MFLVRSCFGPVLPTGAIIMSKPSQGLRALATSLETITAELSPEAQAALGAAADQIHAAADAEAAAEANRVGGPVAGGLLGAFAVTMVDSFFALFSAKRVAATPPSA
jgi:hypothetical protein